MMCRYFTIYFHPKFHVHILNRSSETAVTPKAKENVRTAVMLEFYYTKTGLDKRYILLQDLLPYIA
jgi:hypothetical protein